MAKGNKSEQTSNVPIEEETDIDKLLNEYAQKSVEETQNKQADSDKAPRKPVRAVKTINADGRLLAAYEALRKEGYKKSFDDFLVDASMFFAKGKYGLDFVIEKSLTPDDSNEFFKVRKKNDDEDNDENNKNTDPLDMAIKILMGGGIGGLSEDPRVMVLTTLLEQRRLDLEEKRTKIERERLENERIKAEIEKLKKSESEGQPSKNSNDNIMDVIKFIVDQNQKFYESMADIYKSTANINKGSNNNETLELYKMLSQQQQQYYQTITNFITNTQLEKIKELESYVSAMNPGVWLTQKAEEFKALKDIFGGGSGKTPEEIEKEYQLRLEELKLKHEQQREERETQRAIELTNSIKEGLTAFTEQIGRPLGEALASQIRNMSSKPQQSNTETENTGPKKYNIPLENNSEPNIVVESTGVPNTPSRNRSPLEIYLTPASKEQISNTETQDQTVEPVETYENNDES